MRTVWQSISCRISRLMQNCITISFAICTLPQRAHTGSMDRVQIKLYITSNARRFNRSNCSVFVVLCLLFYVLFMNGWVLINKIIREHLKYPGVLVFMQFLCVTQNAKKRTYTASVAQTYLGKPLPHIPKVVLFVFCMHCGTSNGNQSKECECVVKQVDSF